MNRKAGYIIAFVLIAYLIVLATLNSIAEQKETEKEIMIDLKDSFFLEFTNEQG